MDYHKVSDTVVIIGGGPSLSIEQVNYAQSQFVTILGINDAYRICPDLHLLYACDKKWWDYHYDYVAGLDCFKYCLEPTMHPGVLQLENDGPDGLSLEWPKIRTGGNGGYQAINLAILLGFNRIILIGYDMQHTGGKVHWFGDHPKGLNNAPAQMVKAWIDNFNELAKLIPDGIEVINCSAETALTCFTRMNLRSAI